MTIEHPLITALAEQLRRAQDDVRAASRAADDAKAAHAVAIAKEIATEDALALAKKHLTLVPK